MIILASKSASRAAMLSAAGIAFEAAPAEVDERALEADMADAAPEEIAQALAAAKAAAISSVRPGDLVLGSDSLVTVGAQRFDKPRSRTEAGEHLRTFSGQVMHLHSAAALFRGGRAVWIDHAMAALHVRQLSDDFIEQYLSREWPAVSHCAGAFRIEGMGAQLFDRIIGDQFTVLGMPLLPVLRALREQGELAS